MSQDNLEVVRRFVEAASRSDFTEVLASYSDDVELVIAVPHLMEGTYSGRESVAQFYVDWYGTFGGDVSFALKEHRDVGDTGRHPDTSR
jgi:ketosteroid isomerase-like protein